MGKGSSSQPSGNTNPAAAAQLPFLTDAWGQAQQLYQSRPSGQGLNIASSGDPLLNTGLNTQYATAENIINPTLRPTSQNVWMNAATGSMGNANSPAYPYYQGFAQGTSGPQQQMGDLYNRAVNASYVPDLTMLIANRLGDNNNLGMSQLGATASGQYLNGNPWFSQMVQNALDPITRNFQTATAPQLDASFASSGRYGSGAMLGQRENAQNVLADQLAKTSSNLYGQNYANERQQQLAAAQQYGGLYNQALAQQGQLYNAAGNQFLQGVQQANEVARQQLAGQEFGAQGLQSGYNTGNQAALTAMQNYPQLAAAQFLGPQAMIQAGTGRNAWEQTYLDEPYSQLTRYLNALGAGNPQQGQGIYSNPTLEAMAGISGGLNLLKQGSGLLGGGTSAASNMVAPAGWIPGTGMGSGIFTNAATGITSDIAGSGFPGLVQAAAPAATTAGKLGLGKI